MPNLSAPPQYALRAIVQAMPSSCALSCEAPRFDAQVPCLPRVSCSSLGKYNVPVYGHVLDDVLERRGLV